MQRISTPRSRNSSNVGLVFVFSQSTTRYSQAFRPSVRPGRRWRGSNPRQTGPCRSQGGFAIHCAIDAPLECGLPNLKCISQPCSRSVQLSLRRLQISENYP
ncbi:hypothetical protein PoB_006048100 [Plakobranchus ocellatus]|uniref:Uncharacterized protein n=1 Tax=Plakobranchus ocellatus TaxID=259542 RepID=A0AAV4CQ85_9GAST|nr:hypothetical protein PoB_006048100 [Plakobranchus ocellatus]